jgi:HK97 family phage portal protein
MAAPLLFNILRPSTWQWQEGDKAVTREERLQVLRSEPEMSKKDYSYIERFTSVPIYKFTDYSSYLLAGSKKVWATFRACHVTASTVLGTDFMIKDKDENAIQPKTLRSMAPDLFRFMRQPNPYDTWQELMYQWTFHMKLTGNPFWLKDEIDLKGRPKNVFSLLPQNVKVIPDPKLRVKGYIYFVNGRQIDITPEEMIHFRRMHPMDNIMGMGDCEPGQDLLSDFINRNTYNERFYENGAMPSGVLTKEDKVENEDVWKKLTDAFRTKYQGKKNAGKVMMLSGKWTYQQLGLNAQQMQNIEKDKQSVEQIFMLHGVPLSVAGLGSANYATAQREEMNFRRYEVKPLIESFTGKMNVDEGIVKANNPDWMMDFALDGLIDIEQVMQEYVPMVEQGAMTPNELRVKAGLPRVDNPQLDQYFVSRNVVPIDMAGMADPATVNPDIQKIMRQTAREKERGK